MIGECPVNVTLHHLEGVFCNIAPSKSQGNSNIKFTLKYFM